MQTALQQLIEWLEIVEQENINQGSSAETLNTIIYVKEKVKSLMPNEKKDLIEAYIVGSLDDSESPRENALEYYSQSFEENT